MIPIAVAMYWPFLSFPKLADKALCTFDRVTAEELCTGQLITKHSIWQSDLAELLLKRFPSLSCIKILKRAALANQPLSRLSTKMTLIPDRTDSRAELFRNGRRSMKSPEHSRGSNIVSRSGSSVKRIHILWYICLCGQHPEARCWNLG